MTDSRQFARNLEQGGVPAAFAEGTAARVTSLDGEWEFAELAPGRDLGPALAEARWRPAPVPGTVAGAMRALGDLQQDRGDLDEREFVYRRRFPGRGVAGSAALVFDGLATLTDAWLNGRRILSARNMFRRHAAAVGDVLGVDNELVLHFRSADAELTRKRPRAKWPTRLVRHRNLRYLRTALLGRIPGWAPAHPAVGPWRGVRLLEQGKVTLTQLLIRPVLDGGDGVVSIALQGRVADGRTPAALKVRISDCFATLRAAPAAGGGFQVLGEVRVPAAAPWWPHDLGSPERHALSLALELGGDVVDLGSAQVGFRRIERQSAGPDDFALKINGRDVFCRGACWTPADTVGLRDDPAEVRRVLGLVRDAGMNMLRLSGALLYESDFFYDACDELGILVWQDFMFASMDYPGEDAEFAEEVRIEADQLLARLHHRPCFSVLCGNSEVEQQAAMNGLPPAVGMARLFRHTLKEAGSRWCPDVPYVPSSPSGGALPFHVDAGVAHYFGVGAYLRPLADARESRVRFASECLAFSNVPEDASLDELFGGETRGAHTPRYKHGVPRDAGSGWDFSDVTDHYIEQLFGCDVRALRYAETERYFALARVATGVLMERSIGLWRAEESPCRGALVWFLRDLQPGSGWGVLDSAGRPKAVYWFLKRACAPRAIWFTDEGLNGLRLHVRNDRAAPLAGRLRVCLLRSNGAETGRGETDVSVAGGDGRSFGVDALLGRFADTAYAYRFGPCEHAIVTAELVLADGTIAAACQFLPAGLGHALHEDVGLRAASRPLGRGAHELRIESRELALFVRISADGFLPADNYFHVAPGAGRTVVLVPDGPERPLQARLEALNARARAGVDTGGQG